MDRSKRIRGNFLAALKQYARLREYRSRQLKYTHVLIDNVSRLNEECSKLEVRMKELADLMETSESNFEEIERTAESETLESTRSPEESQEEEEDEENVTPTNENCIVDALQLVKTPNRKVLKETNLENSVNGEESPEMTVADTSPVFRKSPRLSSRPLGFFRRKLKTDGFFVIEESKRSLCKSLKKEGIL